MFDSVNGAKLAAKRIKAQFSVSMSHAQELAARAAGYRDWHHLTISVGKPDAPKASDQSEAIAQYAGKHGILAGVGYGEFIQEVWPREPLRQLSEEELDEIFNDEDDDPGFWLDTLRDCLSVEQLIGIRWLDARLNGSLDLAKLVGADTPIVKQIEALARQHRTEVKASWNYAYEYGRTLARVLEQQADGFGQQWARAIQTNEGAHLDRADHIIETANYLAEKGFGIVATMHAIELVARMHEHHAEEARLIVQTSQALDRLLPGSKLDQHWVESYGDCSYAENWLNRAIFEEIFDEHAHRTSSIALLHWYMLRLESNARSLGVEVDASDDLKRARAGDSVDNFQVQRHGVERLLGPAPDRPAPTCVAAMGALEPFEVTTRDHIGQLMRLSNQLLADLQSRLPDRQ